MRCLIDSLRAVERWSGEEVAARGLLEDGALARLIGQQESRLAHAGKFIENDRALHATIVTAGPAHATREFRAGPQPSRQRPSNEPASVDVRSWAE